MNIRPAVATLNDLQGGHLMNRLGEAIHEAMGAVQEHSKPATITLTIEVKPYGERGVSDAVTFHADVSTKLPKQQPPATLFFRDADGNPSRRRTDQEDLPGLGTVSASGAVKPSAAA